MSVSGARRRAAALGSLRAWLPAGLLLAFVAAAVRETYLALTTGSPMAPARAGSLWVLTVVTGVAFYFLLLPDDGRGMAAPRRPAGQVSGRDRGRKRRSRRRRQARRTFRV